MGWFSKAFGGAGDFLEDYGLPIVGGVALGALTGGLGALASGAITGSIGGAATAGMSTAGMLGAAFTSGSAITGAIVGGLGGAQIGASNAQAEKAAAAQIAAAQKLADMQDPSRVVQQATAAPQIQRQQQVNEVNEATAKSKKLTLAKMNYNTGLQSFSKLGSFNSSTLG